MKTYIMRQQHKNFKHQDIKQKELPQKYRLGTSILTLRHETKEPPQKYRLGTISNIKLLAGLNRFYRYLTSPSTSAVVHNILLVVRSSW